MSLERLKNPRSLEATSIGHIALETLSNTQQASIMGKTSRGIYVKTSNKWLSFISFEPFNSPLTIVLTEGELSLQHLSISTPIHIARGEILISEIDLTIYFQRSHVWHTQPPPAQPVSSIERRERMVAFLEEAIAGNKGAGLHYLLLMLDNTRAEHLPEVKVHNLSLDNILLVNEYLAQRDTDALIRTLSKFLGAGGGLTPSGDDFLVGLLLSLNRWKDVLWIGDGLHEVNAHITEAAYQKTTTLSANLIECATFGEADQRLIAAIDWLMSQTPWTAEITANLLDWGHSSGVDTLVGFVTALSLGVLDH
jgi:hypothetical protein